VYSGTEESDSGTERVDSGKKEVDLRTPISPRGGLRDRGGGFRDRGVGFRDRGGGFIWPLRLILTLVWRQRLVCSVKKTQQDHI
jgi:hypothetical protein